MQIDEEFIENIRQMNQRYNDLMALASSIGQDDHALEDEESLRERQSYWTGNDHLEGDYSDEEVEEQINGLDELIENVEFINNFRKIKRLLK